METNKERTKKTHIMLQRKHFKRLTIYFSNDAIKLNQDKGQKKY